MNYAKIIALNTLLVVCRELKWKKHPSYFF